jgi:hypothetical protein
MSNRTFLTLGLAMTLAAAAPRALQAEGTTMKWSAGSPTSSGSAEEAAQLARQASELAARAAQMAAAAQVTSANSANASNAPSITAPAPAASAAQTPKVLDIQFQTGATATATDIPMPTIEPIIPAALPAPVQPASQPAATASNNDNQIQLAARTYSDATLLRMAQAEQIPGAPTPQPTRPAGPGGSTVPHDYEGPMYDDACCEPQRVLFWTAGVEATFLNPDLNSNGAFFEVEETYEDRFDSFSSASHDVDSLYFSPRAWIGVQGCLWGGNLRYWHLQASEGAYDPTIGSLGTWDDFDCGVPDIGYFSCSRLEAYTIDLELTRRFCFNDCWMQAAIGLRHAEIDFSESITGLAITDAGLLSGYGRANASTRGTGFLLGLYGRKPVFPCSSVHWFYNVRWSALWGPTNTAVETFASVAASDPDFTASAASVNGAYTCVDDTLFIGEIQLGLEWIHALACIPANAFFRAAIEYQRWDGGPGISGANSFAGITLDGDTTASSIVSTSAVAESPQLDLLGFTIGTGLTW